MFDFIFTKDSIFLLTYMYITLTTDVLLIWTLNYRITQLNVHASGRKMTSNTRLALSKRLHHCNVTVNTSHSSV